MSLNWVRRTQRRIERRFHRERRVRHVLFADWRWALDGRRANGRRTSETAETGVDIYPPRLLAIALAIFLLSCLDAAFTLILVRSNLAVEANPLMRRLMEYDVQTFVNLKIVLTGGGLLFLVALADATLLRRFRVRRVMLALAALYAAIVGLEIARLTIL